MSSTVTARSPADRPTLANWLQHPGNRWSFRHVRELIPTARIAARSPREIEADPIPSLLTAEEQALMVSTCTDALVVLAGGRLALEWYAPGAQADDSHILFSVTKSVTGLVVGALAGQGALDVDQTVAAYVPETTAGGYGDASVRQLLDMTAAVRFTEDYDGADMRAYREAAGLLPTGSEKGLHAFIAQLPGDGGHGRRYRYTSPSTDMLGWICERASGVRFADLVAQYVWGPMGGEHDADLLVDRFGAPRTGGGLCATARDMARIGQLIVDGGEDAIPSSFIAEMMAGGNSALWAAGELSHLLPSGAYRDCWYQTGEDEGTIMAIGIYGQWLYVDVPRRVVIAKQSSGRTAIDPPVDRQVITGLRELAHRAAS